MAIELKGIILYFYMAKIDKYLELNIDRIHIYIGKYYLELNIIKDRGDLFWVLRQDGELSVIVKHNKLSQFQAGTGQYLK